MPREAEPSTNEEAFLLAALQENSRLDGRPFDAFRPVMLDFATHPDEYGSVEVRIGKTRVFCRISCDIVAPYPDRQFDGIFTITAELSPIASPAFEAGRQDQIEIILSRILEKTIRRSGALDTESLCIIAGQKCFHVRADIHLLDHDGNLVDASCLALVAALMHFRRPDIEVHGEDVTVYGIREREPVKLNLQHHPFCVTTSYYDNGKIMLLDATLLEEQCREGEIMISMNRFGEICQIAKYGGVPIEGLTMLSCVRHTLEKVKMFDKLVKDRLANDEKARNIGGLMAELSAENAR